MLGFSTNYTHGEDRTKYKLTQCLSLLSNNSRRKCRSGGWLEVHRLRTLSNVPVLQPKEYEITWADTLK